MSLHTLRHRRTHLTVVTVSLLLVAGAAGFALWGRAAIRVQASAQPGGAPGAAGALPALSGEAAVAQLKQQGLYAALGEAVERTRYDLHYSDGKDLPARLKIEGGAYHAANPAQGLNAYFSSGGMKVVPRGEKKPPWQTGLKLTAYGYGDKLLKVGPGEMKAEHNRIVITKPTIPPSNIHSRARNH
jgi:hypothetical protein